MKKGPKTVAILNGSPAAAEFIASAIRNDGTNTHTFAAAQDMLESIQTDRVPDIIITDLHTPGIDGWRLCRLLRSPEFKQANETPIVVTSSIFLDRDLAAMAQNLGADGYISLPRDADAISNVVANLDAGAPGHAHPLALAVEDDPVMMKFISTGLRAYGYEVIEATTGKEALALFETRKPNLVILDHVLMDMDGIELVPGFRAGERNGDLVLIAITAASDPDLAIRYTREGADAYLRKPFSMPYLTNVISKAQRERALRRVERLIDERTESLREAEQRFRDLYENAPAGYHTVAPDGTILSMNTTELRWLGYARDEVVDRKTIFDLQTPASAIRGRALFKELKASGELNNVELDFVRKDRTTVPVRIHSRGVNNDAGEFEFARTVVHHMGKEKELERQLRHAQKMESLGIMAAGIAHNFNNLLTPVLVNASDLKEDFAENSTGYEVLQDIEEAARRGAALVRQLTTLSRSADTAHALVEPRDIIEETAEILRKTLDKAIRVETTTTDRDTEILGNHGQIQQALLSLAFNARDAMPDGGLLEIDLQVAEIMDITSSFSPPPRPGTYVVISVSDTGVGMSREVQERIFDPFFTTKGLAKGTGLGLSTTYAIVQDHGGFVHVYSEPGIGTRFRMYFPLRTPDPVHSPLPRSAKQHEETESENRHQHLRGDELVLIIDDEQNVLRSATRILKRAGYDVLQATDGIAGLDALRRSQLHRTSHDHGSAGEARPIDLVILDVVMPRMAGEQVLQRIRTISADLPVIVASGYGQTARVLDFLNRGAQNVIGKPFDTAELLKAVRETLDARAARES